jgi:hypothetical protein
MSGKNAALFMLAFCLGIAAIIFAGAKSHPAELDHCLIAGDSIALDVAAYAPHCAVDAKIGIGSAAIVARVRPARTVVISAGSNDPDNPRLAANLAAMRARADTAHVVWIVPVHPRAAVAVIAVAHARGDQVVPFVAARDHVHPKCPRCVAQFVFGRQPTKGTGS